jgi:hypothetical protein
MEALDEALALLADPQIAYAQATPHTQRLLNQALFTALLVRDGEVSGSEQTPWVAALRRLAQTASQPPAGRQNGQKPQARPRNGSGPQKGGRDLNDEEMVRPSGLEPRHRTWLDGDHDFGSTSMSSSARSRGPT